MGLAAGLVISRCQWFLTLPKTADQFLVYDNISGLVIRSMSMFLSAPCPDQNQTPIFRVNFAL